MPDHSKAISDFMELVSSKNDHQPEFIQAVTEVAETVVPFIEDHPKYKKYNILERMCEPERIFIFRVPWLDDQGNYRINRGFRVQMNSAIGPYKGGLRFHPSVNLSILKFLAFEQVYKNALTTLPLGGGKGGSDFDPKGKSEREIMLFCQSFMTELRKHIGASVDVPAGDIGVSGKEIGYLFGQYKRITGEYSGILTGKGIEYGGSLVRTEATGYGVVYFSKEVLECHGELLRNKVCTVSGSGNVAQYTVEKLLDLDAKPVTLSDSGGFIHDPDGIDREKLAFVKDLKNNKRGRISEYTEKYPKATFTPDVNPWVVPCDLAYPCATQNELPLDDAKTLHSNGCIGVFEGANMPTTPDAVEFFREKQILFSPGKASNAGGVATSGLEMAQNSQRLHWTREEVDMKLKQIMEKIHENCVRHGKVSDTYVDYVKGANIAGFVKVADAMLDQGHV